MLNKSQEANSLYIVLMTEQIKELQFYLSHPSFSTELYTLHITCIQYKNFNRITLQLQFW